MRQTVLLKGTFQEIKIIKGPDETLNEESLRVIRIIGRGWKPATFRGKPVKISMALPIAFKLR